MSLFHNNILAGASGQGGSYQIGRSLRFNNDDTAYLNFTPSSAGNRRTWTWSSWVKFSSGDRGVLFSQTATGSQFFILEHRFQTLNIYDYTGGVYNSNLEPTAVLRDYSAWYHIIFTFDTTNATAADRQRLYINGERVTDFSGQTTPTQNLDGFVNTAASHNISGYSNGTLPFDGYLADTHFIDGQSLQASDFGKYDDNNVWQPIEYAGTYGTNGWHLDFSDNTSTTTIAEDSSGNGNDWTANNISVTAGAGNDSLLDSPTNGTQSDSGAGGEVSGNYCTLNPLGIAGGTPSNGNLSVSSSSTVGNRISTFFVTSGKWYWEGVGSGYVGAIIGSGGEGYTGSISVTGSKSIGWWELGPVYWDGGNNAGSTSYSTSDVIGVALDMDAGNVKFYKNGSLTYTITFGSGTVPDLSSGVFAGYNVGLSTKSVDLNFGQRAFTYAAPSGYKCLCTANLDDPTIADGSTGMDSVVYSGNSSTQTISGLNFSPDLVWIKSRSQTRDHKLVDSVRGVGEELEPNQTTAEVTNSDGLTAFNSDGFSIGDDFDYNVGGGNTYVAWAWDAGSSTVSNTDGTITSQVRANPSSGFSIVSYTGTSANATLGHGLNAAPEMIIIKNRDRDFAWFVYHESIGPTKNLKLNESSAATTVSSYFNNTAPTSSVFSVGAAVGTNYTGEDIIAYCFAPVEGYSAFGSYTGNGSADGPFVYTGFQPRWIMIKSTASTNSWVVHDTARDPHNAATRQLLTNDSAAELDTALTSRDFLSNGFKLRNTNASINTSSVKYIYAAFAEHPFKTSRAN